MGWSIGRGLVASSVLLVLCASSRLAAAEGAADVAAAQALFDEGKSLMDARRFREACPKLAESQRLDPGGGTTLLLAMCHEGEGRLASAWADYNQAVTEARRDRRADRERAAEAKVKELAPRLARMRVVSLGNEDGLELKRDGTVLGRAQWSTAIPVDPGEIRFEATAPGRKPWQGVVRIEGEGKLFEVRIPALEAAPVVVAPAPPPTTAPEARGRESASPSRTPPPSSSSSDRILVSAVVGGAGVLALGVGSVVGLSAMSSWKSVHDACPGGRCTTDASVKDAASVRSRADASTVLFVLGGLAVAAGVTIYVAWPSGEPEDAKPARAFGVTPFATAHGGGLSLGGAL